MVPFFFIVLLTYTIVVPLVIGCYYYGRLSKAMKILTVLVAIGTVNESIQFVTGMLKINNLYTVHIYTVLELLLLTSFYYVSIKAPWRQWILVFAVALIIFSAGYALYGNNLYGFNSLPRAAECFLIVYVSAWLFYEMATTGDSKDPARSGLFYINGAAMFYFGSSFIIFAFSNYMMSDNNHLLSMYQAHSFVNGFCNLVYAAGIWISRSYSIAA